MEEMRISEIFRDFIISERDIDSDEWDVFSTFMLGDMSLNEYISMIKHDLETFYWNDAPRLSWNTYGVDSRTIREYRQYKDGKLKGVDKIAFEKHMPHAVAQVKLLECPVDAVYNKEAYMQYLMTHCDCDVRTCSSWLSNKGANKFKYDYRCINTLHMLALGGSIPSVFVISDKDKGGIVHDILHGFAPTKWDSMKYNVVATDYERLHKNIRLLCVKWQTWLINSLYESGILSLCGVYCVGKTDRKEVKVYNGSNPDNNMIKFECGTLLCAPHYRTIDYLLYEEK